MPRRAIAAVTAASTASALAVDSSATGASARASAERQQRARGEPCRIERGHGRRQVGEEEGITSAPPLDLIVPRAARPSGSRRSLRSECVVGPVVDSPFFGRYVWPSRPPSRRPPPRPGRKASRPQLALFEESRARTPKAGRPSAAPSPGRFRQPAPKRPLPPTSRVPPVETAAAPAKDRAARHRRVARAEAAGDLRLGVLRQEPPPARLRQPLEGPAHHHQGGRRQLARRLRGGRHPSRAAASRSTTSALEAKKQNAELTKGEGRFLVVVRGQRPGNREGPGAEDLRQAALRLEVPPPEAGAGPAGHRDLRRRDVRPAHHRQAHPGHEPRGQGQGRPTSTTSRSTPARTSRW